MAEPEKLDATFYAFRRRDRRYVITRAAIGYFILYAIITAVALALMWAALGAIVAWYASVMQAATQGVEPAPPPAEVLRLAPFGVLFGLIGLALFAAFEAACLRWFVRGESGGGLLGLTAGADTWRVFAVYFVWLGFFIGFSLLIVLFYALTGVIASMGAGIVAMLLGALAPLGFLALLIWGAVRFAPAAAASIARRRFAFFEAPRITRGRFWPLLGAFVIVWVGYIVLVSIVGTIIQLPAQNVMAPVMVSIMSGAGDVGPRMLEAMSSPVYLASMGAYTVFTTIAAIVFYVALFGVNARAVLAADETSAASR